MNWDQIEGVKQFKGNVREQWRKLPMLIRAAHRAPNQDYRKIDYIDIVALGGMKEIS